MFKKCLLVIFACLSMIAPQVRAECPCKCYTIMDVGTLTGPYGYSLGLGINSIGQVVGYSSITGNVADQADHAFRTKPNAPINPETDDLGTLGGKRSEAHGINDSGQVVGFSDITDNDPFHAFRTEPNAKIDPYTDKLGTLGGTGSWAMDINDSGQAVGDSDIDGDVACHAFRTGPNAKINPGTDDLGTLGGTNSHGYGINDSGQAVGDSDIDGDVACHAFRTGPNAKINPGTDDLGTLGGTNSWAFAINDSEQVVGWSDIPGDTSWHAFLWTPDGTEGPPINPDTDDLGTLGGPNSRAFDINFCGWVVGEANTDNNDVHAFLYTDKMYDLNDLIPPGSGWELARARGINDAGQIVGFGSNPDGEFHGFLLTPVFYGDCDLDGDVDHVDFLWFSIGWFGPDGADPVNPTPPASWETGDFDGDGDVDGDDFILFSQGWFGPPNGAGYPPPDSAVPEPGTIRLLVIGIFGFLAYARRRRRS